VLDEGWDGGRGGAEGWDGGWALVEVVVWGN